MSTRYNKKNCTDMIIIRDEKDEKKIVIKVFIWSSMLPNILFCLVLVFVWNMHIAIVPIENYFFWSKTPVTNEVSL